MITNLSAAEEFKAIPYLRTSAIMQNHQKGIAFSNDKPNVIVGPNGAGKSALVTTLALKTLSFTIGESVFDRNFITDRDADAFWTQIGYRWSNEYAYLHGLTCKSDNAPALYYRPGHIPGNETSPTHAMMTGYFDVAKAYARKVENKSSGQQCQSLLEKVWDLLSGEAPDLQYQYVNWGYGREPKKLDKNPTEYECKAEALKALYGSVQSDAVPVLLMDEPEQSLDARAETMLWKQIADADTSRLQIIVATHSLYPLLHPERFHLIEAEPGYAAQVRDLLQLT